MTQLLSLPDVHALACDCLTRAGVREANALLDATRQEVAPLCDSLAARLDANLFYTRLKRHGRQTKGDRRNSG